MSIRSTDKTPHKLEARFTARAPSLVSLQLGYKLSFLVCLCMSMHLYAHVGVVCAGTDGHQRPASRGVPQVLAPMGAGNGTQILWKIN